MTDDWLPKELGHLRSELFEAKQRVAELEAGSCTCESLIDQIQRLGKPLEGPCPIHEWRIVGRVRPERLRLLEIAADELRTWKEDGHEPAMVRWVLEKLEKNR